MNFKDRILKAKEEERLAQIKLEENKRYDVEIISASLQKQENTGYDMVSLQLKCIDPEVEGKIIRKTLVIDEKTKNPLQGQIGLSQLVKLLEHFKLEFEDEKSLVVALIDLKQKIVKIEPEKKIGGDQKIYTNYKFILE